MVDDNRREEEEDAAVKVAGHPYHFLVSGPRNIPSPNWKDLLRSSWKDPDYRRTAMACFVQAAYLLELDRQEKRAEATGLAPNWWKPFEFKLGRTLVDARDGSIYGAVLEWDRAAAMADLVLVRPRRAPKLVLALRGTLLRRPTVRRDLLDDLRFVARESLKGSVRFAGALEVVRSAAERFGSARVCVCGHSLGAAFALQVGKALAKEGLLVECHLFNPPLGLPRREPQDRRREGQLRAAKNAPVEACFRQRHQHLSRTVAAEPVREQQRLHLLLLRRLLRARRRRQGRPSGEAVRGGEGAQKLPGSSRPATMVVR